MGVSVILAISLAAVLASSLLLIGPFHINGIIPKQNSQVQQAEAAPLPLIIRDRFAEKQLAGDATAASRFLNVNEEFVDPESHCEFCTRVEYSPGPQGVAGFSYKDATGVDLSNAKKVRFWVMGEEGNEKIKFKLAGKSFDKIQDKFGKLTEKLAAKSIFKTELFALTTQEVTLDDDWKKYEVDLTGVDLREITHPFAFELTKNSGETQVVYIKGVVYDDEPAEDPLATIAENLTEPLVAEINSNATEGIGPATIEFEVNVTGGIEPYTIAWDFDDNSSDEGRNVVHTFVNAGEYNVTVTVSDAGSQNESDSLMIQIVEPILIDEETDNSTQTDTNLTNALEETNSTDIGEQQTTSESIEIQADAGIDIVAQPGDTVVIGGELTGVDAETDNLEVAWTQISGSIIDFSNSDSLNSIITIPDIEDDEVIELELAATLGTVEASDSVRVFVEYPEEVDNAQEESLEVAESVVTEWSDGCDDLVDCMSDESADTFASASPEDIENANLFSFEEFNIENAEIQRVTAVATAKTDETGYLLFIGSDKEDTDDRSEPVGAVSILSNSAREYEYVWEENPITNAPWTEESLDSFLAGYAYGDGDSIIEVSEFSLIITYTIVEEEPEETSTESPASSATEGSESDGQNVESQANQEVGASEETSIEETQESGEVEPSEEQSDTTTNPND